MERLNDVVKTLTFGFGLMLVCAGAIAADEVLEVEVFNATAHNISPDPDFAWLENPLNAGHDFVVEPKSSQELMYYLPTSRSADAFTYRQGDQACHFSFGHQTPNAIHLNRWAKAKSTGLTPITCAAELVVTPDDDEFVRNGGTRVLFTMG
ncbi:hypothetical protein AQS70_14890 [Pseudomonas endophytica]|uniref:Uncharacterized protein n=1 Tax=Pseudomonas endophytica TaxID=1563157 RepID=A0A0Q0SLL1_9PSED|nr:hypothetical protein [Pseudomonas endophytica]KQB52315.1 hypothetical protein AQS70_14890 [Pseudomonas endophytica]